MASPADYLNAGEQAIPMMQLGGSSGSRRQPEPQSDSSGGKQQQQQQQQVQQARDILDQKSHTSKMGEVDEQPSPSGMLGWLGFGLAVFSLACLGISFASPYWFQTYPGSFNEFKNMGLWEVCFDNYMHHKDDSQEIYNGCWWVFDTDQKYWKLREWLLPPWFISVQVMATASLLIEMGTVVAAAFIFLHFCPIMNHEYHQTYAMFACAALQFLATMVITIGCAVYAAMVGDRQWMPRPDLNFMSWGYGFAILFGLFALASGVCFFLEARKAFDELMRRDEEYTRAVLEMSHATYPMGASYGAPSYAPSYPDVQGQPSYSDEPKQPISYSTQPSHGGQSGYDYGGDEKAGYGGGGSGAGYNQPQTGYSQPQPGYSQPQPGYSQPQPGYGGAGSQSGYGGGGSQSGYGGGGSQSGYGGESQSGYGGGGSQSGYGGAGYGQQQPSYSAQA